MGLTAHSIKIDEPITARRRVVVYLLDDSTGVTPQTGVTVSGSEIQITTAGGSVADFGGSLTEITPVGRGVYYYTLSAAEVATAGPVSFVLSQSGIRDHVKEIQVVSSDPAGLIVQDETTATKRTILIYLVDADDGVTPEIGVTPAAADIKISKNDGVFYSGTLTQFSEIGDGLYAYALQASDVDTIGFLAFTMSESTYRPFVKDVQIGVPTAVVEPETSPSSFRIPLIEEEELRTLLAKDPVTGAPKYAAIRTQVHDSTAPQKHDILFWPVPDQQYRIEYRYNRRPSVLDLTTVDDPHGSWVHGQTAIASCLAAAELRVNKKQDAMWAHYMERLKASIQVDRKSTAQTARSTQPLKKIDPGTNLIIENRADAAPGMNFYALMRDVGQYLGYSANPDALTHEQDTFCRTIIQSGVHEFHYPLKTPSRPQVHEWTFLKSIHSFDTVADQEDYTQSSPAAGPGIPASFGGCEGDMTYVDPTDTFRSIEVVGENTVRRLRSRTDTLSGRPRFAAFQSVVGSGSDQNFSWTLMLWPTPEGVYTLEYKYHTVPNEIGDSGFDQLFAIGVPVHSQAIFASCMAEAELRKTGQEGPWKQKYMMRLDASVSYDMKGTNAEYYGYNGDNSDWVHGDPHGHYRDRDYNSVTYLNQSFP